MKRVLQLACSQLVLINAALYRPFGEIHHFTFNFQFLHRIYTLTTHFHLFDILHWKQITLIPLLVNCMMQNKLYSEHNVLDTKKIFHHYTQFTLGTNSYDFLWKNVHSQLGKFYSALF
jgi:hypothetical protein